MPRELTHDELALAFSRYTASPEARDIFAWLAKQNESDSFHFVIDDGQNKHLAVMRLDKENRTIFDDITMRRMSEREPDAFTKEQIVELINAIADTTSQAQISLNT